MFICPAALRLVSTAELVIAQAIDHFNGNTSSHLKREEVLIQRQYRLLLLDHEIDSRGNNDNFRIPQRQNSRLCSLNQQSTKVVICPAALRLMSTAELVIAQAIDHFNGNTSSRVKRKKVLIQRRYRLLLLDPKVDSCGNSFRMPQRQTSRLCSLNQ